MKSSNIKTKILAYLPTPPPFAGPEVASEMLLNGCKNGVIKIKHLKSNIRDENWKKGKFDLHGLIIFGRIYYKFISHLLTQSPDKIYFLLSSSIAGFLRDSVIILTAKLFKKKNIAHYRGGNFHNFFNQQNRFLKWYIKYILNKIDCIIIQADRLKFMFSTIYEESKIKVLYNGLILDNYKIIEDDSFGDKKPFTILFMGHISFSKGFFECVQAIKELSNLHYVKFAYAGTKRYSKDKNKTAKGFLSGESLQFFQKHEEKIETTITNFIANEKQYHAEYLGIISGEKKRAAFSQADLFILPSYTEGFSMSVLEAMAFGLPVIVSNVGALPEIIEDGINGYIINPGDKDMLLKKMIAFIQAPEEARQIGATNKQYVTNNFAIELIAPQLERILLSV